MKITCFVSVYVIKKKQRLFHFGIQQQIYRIVTISTKLVFFVEPLQNHPNKQLASAILKSGIVTELKKNKITITASTHSLSKTLNQQCAGNMCGRLDDPLANRPVGYPLCFCCKLGGSWCGEVGSAETPPPLPPPTLLLLTCDDFFRTFLFFFCKIWNAPFC